MVISSKKINFTAIFDDLLDLIYPKLCTICSDLLISQESFICKNCLYHIPKTNFHNDQANPVAEIFWGRVNIEHASSFFYFSKGGKSRKLLHKLKYRGNTQLAYVLGKAYGTELKKNGVYTNTDMVLPVPLHKEKEKSRGFNQSEWIALGIAEALSKSVEKILDRKVNNPSQTRKSRYERWENVENVFIVKHPEKIEGKHLLLVDDVITTGATLEACTQALKNAADCRVSIVTLAVS